MTHLDDLSAEFVRSILHYDEKTGCLFWKSRTDIPLRVNKRLAGKKAGCVWKGRKYVSVGINQRQYLAHRLVWLIVTGSWPDGGLDHRDEDTSNNRFSNLRPSNQSQNMSNRGKQRNNASGFKGVYFDKTNGRWVANIMHKQKTIFLGRHAAPELAAAAYNEAAARLFGEFAKLNPLPSNDNRETQVISVKTDTQ